MKKFGFLALILVASSSFTATLFADIYMGTGAAMPQDCNQKGLSCSQAVPTFHATPAFHAKTASPVPYKGVHPATTQPVSQVHAAAVPLAPGPVIAHPFHPHERSSQSSISSASVAQGYNVTLYPGSLKANIERIVHQSGWGKVVWTLPYDYHWVGKTHVSGATLQSVLGQIFAQYPAQAVFYSKNQIIAIVPRTYAS